jgi:hypothetical protein
MFGLITLLSLIITRSYGIFTEKIYGNYVSLFGESINWFNARQYCITNYGTDLASIHSSQDLIDYFNSLQSTTFTWMGLNDINNEAGADTSFNSGWEYSDGTSYDHALNFGFISTSEGLDCFNSVNSQFIVDIGCDWAWNFQFVCNYNSCPQHTDCVSSPCSCDEALNCGVCNSGSGCSQCSQGYFKKDRNSQCIFCDDWSDGCRFCQDFNGCGQCKDGYNREYNLGCGLWECKSSSSSSIECEDESSLSFIDRDNCPVECDNEPCNCSDLCFCDDGQCHENGCDQCKSGYFKKDYHYHCIKCDTMFGEGCNFCQDFNGCGECDHENGYTRVFDQTCGLYKCQHED